MTFKRRGAEQGSGFQEAINRTNEAYERAGRACITRKAIPGKYLVDRGEARRGLAPRSLDLPASGGQARLAAGELRSLVRERGAQDWRRFVPESKAEPDYGGVIAPVGRGIFYDAKTTRRDALDFDNLHLHQVIFLERMARFGAAAGFLVEFSHYDEIFFLPIQVLALWREESARKSLPYQFFAAHLVPAPPGKGLLIFDYLWALDEQEERFGRSFASLQLAVPRPRAPRKLING
jgi:penicillin-binding protein-related factor A (putative recombinase)